MRRTLICTMAVAFLAFVHADAAEQFRIRRQRLLRVAEALPLAAPGDGFSDLRFSPDGQYLLFRDAEACAANLWIARANGRDARLLSRQAEQAAWSPHARRVAFIRERTVSAWDLWTVRPDGTDERLVARSLRNDPWATYRWSPAGDRIAYVSGGDLWVMDPDGANKRRLLGGWVGAFGWTPDGGSIGAWCPICYSYDETGVDAHIRSHTRLVRVRDGVVTTIKPPAAGMETGQVALSSNGRHLALVCYGPGMLEDRPGTSGALAGHRYRSG